MSSQRSAAPLRDAAGGYFERVTYRDAAHPAVQAYARPKLDYLARYVPLAEQTALDVGCGNGVFTEPLATRCARVVGLDRSANMLLANRAQPLARGDATALPFRDGAFSLVFEANLLHHASDPGAVVREMARVASRYVVLIEPNRLNPFMFLFGALVRAERGVLRSGARTLEPSLVAAGLDLVHAAAMGMITQNLTPTILVPLLARCDRAFRWGAYVMLIARHRTS
jgi:SAM-dependent methyltransferase